MSETEVISDPGASDSFWEVDCYKRTVRRTEDGLQSCHDLVKMCQERADIEKEYAKRLKSWSRKWTEFYDKGTEYGSTKVSMKSCLEEAEKIADVHLTIKDRLGTDLQVQVKEWRNEHYKKQMVGNCKEAKQFEEDFKKVQKPWKTRYNKLMKGRKDFHNACKQEKTALNLENNAKNSSDVSVDQLRKFQERVDKCKKEVILAREKYEQALIELNAYNGRYIEDMAEVFQKTQEFEERRLNFIKAILFRFQASLDLTKFNEIPSIYVSQSDAILSIDARRDLRWWSSNHGPDMSMTWPTFEEYSPDLHSITGKSSRSSEGGVTLTYLQKNDSANNHAKSTYLNSAEVNQISQPSSGTLNRTSVLSSTSSNRSSQLNSIPEDDTEHTNNSNKHHNNNTGNSINNTNNNKIGNSGNNTNNNKTGNSSNNTNNNSNDTTEAGGGMKVRALYDYEGREKDELTLRVGDVFVKLRDRDDQGWCTGMKHNKVGLYPDNYVELLSDNPF